jgi:HNH endonuclease
VTVTAERAREQLDYDPVTGVLRKRNRQTGKWRVVQSINKDGYFSVRLSRKTYIAHRVIFLVMTGRWPEPGIDHINRDKTDNRWANLREASAAENNNNRGPAVRRPIANVYQMANTGRFEARAFIDGRKQRLGTYDTAEEAAEAIKRRKTGVL